MHATGYLDQKKQYPLGLGAAVAIHVVAVGVLWMAKNDYLPPIEDILIVEPIPIPDPPPKRAPQPAPRETVRATDPPPHAPIPLVPPRDDTLRAVPFPPAEPLTAVGSGEGMGILVMPPLLPILTEATVDPRFADDLQPPYPAGKQRLGEEGLVVVRVLIGADGRVKKVEPANGADGAFFDATERHALRRWRFKPATRGGVPVESWRTMTVRFEMRG